VSGRPAPTSPPATVVAIDLGGTAMKGGVATAAGVLEHTGSRPTEREAGPEAVLERVGAFAAALIAAAGDGVAAVGVAVPGLVDEAAGVARASVNLGWHDLPLRRRLEERLELPVAVAHDVRAAARAEAASGAARGCRDWLLVTLGTGSAPRSRSAGGRTRAPTAPPASSGTSSSIPPGRRARAARAAAWRRSPRRPRSSAATRSSGPRG